jgi:hypothetical protein
VSVLATIAAWWYLRALKRAAAPAVVRARCLRRLQEELRDADVETLPYAPASLVQPTSGTGLDVVVEQTTYPPRSR